MSSDPVSWSAVEDGLRGAWILPASGFAEDHVIWAQQGGVRPSDPWISLNLLNVQEVGLDWTDYGSNPLTFSAITVSAVSGSVFTAVGHGRSTGDGPIQLTGTLPSPLALLTDYWLIVTDADHFQVAASYTDSINPGDNSSPIPITLTSGGSGIQVVQTDDTEAKGQELVAYTRGQWVGTLSIQCFASAATGTGDAMSVVSRIMMYARTGPIIRALNAAGIGISDFSPVKSIGQAISMTIFEPRAVMTCKFFLAAQLENYTTYIARVTGTTPTIDSGRRPRS